MCSLHKDFCNIISTNQNDISDDLSQLFWQEQFKEFQTTDRGMRWHQMMMCLAILLHSRGPDVYNTFWETGILKLVNQH